MRFSAIVAAAAALVVLVVVLGSFSNASNHCGILLVTTLCKFFEIRCAVQCAPAPPLEELVVKVHTTRRDSPVRIHTPPDPLIVLPRVGLFVTSSA